MTDYDDQGGHRLGSTYRVAGALTITRAASTQREIDALPDPLTIDLSEIERMDTVGAWLVYRAVRDRGAKVIGASRDETSLVDQVAGQASARGLRRGPEPVDPGVDVGAAADEPLGTLHERAHAGSPSDTASASAKRRSSTVRAAARNRSADSASTPRPSSRLR